MARKRTIDPDSWTDEKLAELSIGAHLLWVGLVSFSDDEGRIQWSARQFKARIFPFKDEATMAAITAWMEELSTDRIGRAPVQVYDVEGVLYACHPNWAKHQYVNKPTKSKLPAHGGTTVLGTEEARNLPESAPIQTRRGVNPEKVAEDSRKLPEESENFRSSHVPSVSVSVSDTVSVSGERERAREFALFFYRAAIVDELISEVNDPNVWASTYRHEAAEFLRLYPEDHAKSLALAFLRGVKLGTVRRAASLRSLIECRDWREVRAEIGRMVQPVVESPVVRRLREAEQRSESQRAATA